MIIPFLALLGMVSVLAWGALYATSQTRHSLQGHSGERRQPVEAGSFIAAMFFVAIAGVIAIPLLIFMILMGFFW